MKKCYIMRGASGSGKSTWASNLPGNSHICSADTYHYEQGVYKFVPENALMAHNACLNDFLRAIDMGCPLVIVDNTNIRMFEIAPYYRIAEARGYEVQIIQFISNPEVCKKRNVHGVPAEVIDNMIRNMEPIPPFWNVQYVFGDKV